MSHPIYDAYGYEAADEVAEVYCAAEVIGLNQTYAEAYPEISATTSDDHIREIVKRQVAELEEQGPSRVVGDTLYDQLIDYRDALQGMAATVDGWHQAHGASIPGEDFRAMLDEVRHNTTTADLDDFVDPYVDLVPDHVATALRRALLTHRDTLRAYPPYLRSGVEDYGEQRERERRGRGHAVMTAIAI